MGRDILVGIAARYMLDGPGIESWLGRDFPHPSRPALEPILTPIQWLPGFFPGGKVGGVWRVALMDILLKCRQFQTYARVPFLKHVT